MCVTCIAFVPDSNRVLKDSLTLFADIMDEPVMSRNVLSKNSLTLVTVFLLVVLLHSVGFRLLQSFNLLFQQT